MRQLIFYIHKLRNYIALSDNLPDNSLYMLFVESTQDYVPMHKTTYQTTPMCLPCKLRLLFKQIMYNSEMK
jgi:hypothetical protein